MASQRAGDAVAARVGQSDLDAEARRRLNASLTHKSPRVGGASVTTNSSDDDGAPARPREQRPSAGAPPSPATATATATTAAAASLPPRPQPHARAPVMRALSAFSFGVRVGASPGGSASSTPEGPGASGGIKQGSATPGPRLSNAKTPSRWLMAKPAIADMAKEARRVRNRRLFVGVARAIGTFMAIREAQLFRSRLFGRLENMPLSIKDKVKLERRAAIARDLKNFGKPQWVLFVERYLLIWPSSRFARLWDMIYLAAVMWIAVHVPFSTAFENDSDADEAQGSGDWVLAMLDTVSEIIFYTDIVLTFVSVYNDEGEEVEDPRQIIRHYCRGWLAVDVIAAFPYRLISSSGVLGSSKVIRLLRIGKVEAVESRLAVHMDMNERARHSLRMLKLVFYSCTVAHIAACAWWAIARFDGMGEDSWPVQAGVDLEDKSETYVAAVYWSFATLTTVGYGDISAGTTAERLFSLVMIVLGACFFGLTVGKMSELAQSMNKHLALVKAKHLEVDQFLKFRNIPRELRARVREYYDYLARRKSFINEAALLTDMSPSLRRAILRSINKDVIDAVPLFKFLSVGFQNTIATKLRPTFCLPLEYLIVAGDVVQEVYFCKSGRVQVLGLDGIQRVQLEQGSVIGETDILDRTRAHFSVRAVRTSEFLMLTREDLVEVLLDHPEFEQTLRQVGQWRQVHQSGQAGGAAARRADAARAANRKLQSMGEHAGDADDNGTAFSGNPSRRGSAAFSSFSNAGSPAHRLHATDGSAGSARHRQGSGAFLGHAAAAGAAAKYGDAGGGAAAGTGSSRAMADMAAAKIKAARRRRQKRRFRALRHNARRLGRYLHQCNKPAHLADEERRVAEQRKRRMAKAGSRMRAGLSSATGSSQSHAGPGGARPRLYSNDGSGSSDAGSGQTGFTGMTGLTGLPGLVHGGEERPVTPPFGHDDWDEIQQEVMQGATFAQKYQHIVRQSRMMQAELFDPAPLDLSAFPLPPGVARLVDCLAESAHDERALALHASGWLWGPATDAERKLSSELVPWNELDEEARDLAATMVEQALKHLRALGFVIAPPAERDSDDGSDGSDGRASPGALGDGGTGTHASKYLAFAVGKAARRAAAARAKVGAAAAERRRRPRATDASTSTEDSASWARVTSPSTQGPFGDAPDGSKSRIETSATGSRLPPLKPAGGSGAAAGAAAGAAQAGGQEAADPDEPVVLFYRLRRRASVMLSPGRVAGAGVDTPTANDLAFAAARRDAAIRDSGAPSGHARPGAVAEGSPRSGAEAAAGGDEGESKFPDRAIDADHGIGRAPGPGDTGVQTADDLEALRGYGGLRRYYPEAINVGRVTALPEEVQALLPVLAANAHEVFSEWMMDHGWLFGHHVDHQQRKHHMLVPWAFLTEAQHGDYASGVEAIVKGLMALGYEVTRAGAGGKPADTATLRAMAASVAAANAGVGRAGVRRGLAVLPDGGAGSSPLMAGRGAAGGTADSSPMGLLNARDPRSPGNVHWPGAGPSAGGASGVGAAQSPSALLLGAAVASNRRATSPATAAAVASAASAARGGGSALAVGRGAAVPLPAASNPADAAATAAAAAAAASAASVASLLPHDRTSERLRGGSFRVTASGPMASPTAVLHGTAPVGLAVGAEKEDPWAHHGEGDAPARALSPPPDAGLPVGSPLSDDDRDRAARKRAREFGLPEPAGGGVPMRPRRVSRSDKARERRRSAAHGDFTAGFAEVSGHRGARRSSAASMRIHGRRHSALATSELHAAAAAAGAASSSWDAHNSNVGSLTDEVAARSGAVGAQGAAAGRRLDVVEGQLRRMSQQMGGLQSSINTLLAAVQAGT